MFSRHLRFFLSVAIREDGAIGRDWSSRGFTCKTCLETTKYPYPKPETEPTRITECATDLHASMPNRQSSTDKAKQQSSSDKAVRTLFHWLHYILFESLNLEINKALPWLLAMNQMNYFNNKNIFLDLNRQFSKLFACVTDRVGHSLSSTVYFATEFYLSKKCFLLLYVAFSPSPSKEICRE